MMIPNIESQLENQMEATKLLNDLGFHSVLDA